MRCQADSCQCENATILINVESDSSLHASAIDSLVRDFSVSINFIDIVPSSFVTMFLQLADAVILTSVKT